jgi:transcription elongation GreA/GreB family factor
MSITSERLREYFNHDLTDDAADEIEALEAQVTQLQDTVRRCKIVMECNDPTNYKLIFGNT